MSNESIDSILHENRSFAPAPLFSNSARIKSRSELDVLRKKAAADHPGFWADLARREISWIKKFEASLDSTNAPHFRWFSDGLLNVSYNCIDRHLNTRADKTAILFEGEQGDVRKLTYRDLHRDVCRFANALHAKGIVKGDRVVIYMPMVPEAVIAMQACARIGAIHSVVFGGFSAEALKDRIEDASAKAVVTADGGWRGGKIVELKAACDRALREGGKTVETLFVLRRTGHNVSMQPGRDIWWSDAVESQLDDCEPLAVEAEHPLFILYTSGSTGKPKGVQHSSAGYLLGTIMTMQWVFDIQDNDIFWCTADVGWVTGHSYIAYGPLANGTTVVMYEGAPTVPDAGRFWSICERHKVTIFYTAPTAIRASSSAICAKAAA
jgi:acetyl-CoA synthetase